MWIPEKYRIEDEHTIADFIASVGLATLITMDNNFPVATHAPIELEYTKNGDKVLRGHIAKINPQTKILKSHPNALVIFQSPIQHYISSSWYSKPNAPTWNYMSVHLYGKVSILNDGELWHSVDRLTQRHEKISKCPISLQSLPDNIQGMLKAVTGFEILVEKIEASFKLSQNRNSDDLENIIQELSALDTPLSTLMSKILTQNKNN